MLTKIEVCNIEIAQTTANEMSLSLEANGRKVIGIDVFTTRTTGHPSDPKVEVAIVVKYTG